jgi:hypothetical protein
LARLGGASKWSRHEFNVKRDTRINEQPSEKHLGYRPVVLLRAVVSHQPLAGWHSNLQPRWWSERFTLTDYRQMYLCCSLAYCRQWLHRWRHVRYPELYLTWRTLWSPSFASRLLRVLWSWWYILTT